MQRPDRQEIMWRPIIGRTVEKQQNPHNFYLHIVHHVLSGSFHLYVLLWNIVSAFRHKKPQELKRWSALTHTFNTFSSFQKSYLFIKELKYVLNMALN